MCCTVFYDREIERDKMSISIQKKGEKAKIILLYGHTGVGKTGLMSELFHTVLSPCPHARIQISKIAPDTIEKCFYLNQIYEELLKQSKDDLSPENLNSEHPLVSLRFRQLLRFLLRWGSSILHIYEKETFFEDQSSADLIQKRDFIVECLNKKPYIVDLENVQFIDRQSFDFLKDIVSHARNTVFVFEYTLRDDKPNSYEDFYAELSRFDADIERFFLERLNDTDALKLAVEKPKDEYDREKILNSYHQSNGNLYQIILYDSNTFNTSNQIQSRIEDLVQQSKKSTELFLLNLVYLNGGKIEKKLLRSLVTDSEISGQFHLPHREFEEALGEIIKAHLMDYSVKQGNISIHDSILTALEDQPLNPVLFDAYGVLVNFYSAKISTVKSVDIYCLAKLFSLYLRFKDEQLLTILPAIRTAVLSYKYPQEIYQRLEQFIDLLPERSAGSEAKLHQAVCKLLVELCIELGDTKKAWEIFSYLKKLDPSEERLLKARIYELGMDIAEVNAISELSSVAPKNSREKLLLELSQIHVAMRVQPQAETHALVLEVVQNKAYSIYSEYAFALADLAELVDDSLEAINLYQEGISLLESHCRHELSACLYANMCMSLGYLGRLEEGRDCLSKMYKDGLNEPVYLNNSVALDLLESNITKDSIKKLQDALLLRVNRFEELIIRNNLLITSTLQTNWEIADAEYDYLRESGFEAFRYGEFLQMCYQNLFFYCTRRGYLEQASSWKTRLTDLAASPNISEGTKMVIDAMLHQDSSKIFYGNYPYRAEFLCYWGIPPSYVDSAFSAK